MTDHPCSNARACGDGHADCDRSRYQLHHRSYSAEHRAPYNSAMLYALHACTGRPSPCADRICPCQLPLVQATEAGTHAQSHCQIMRATAQHAHHARGAQRSQLLPYVHINITLPQ
eukprot:jgi/Ulvmu1/8674/UM047_0012.1